MAVWIADVVCRWSVATVLASAPVGLLGVENFAGFTSLDRGRSACGWSRMPREVLCNHVRQGDPKLSDRLVSVLLSRVVQSNALLGRDKRCGQVPPEHFVFRQ